MERIHAGAVSALLLLLGGCWQAVDALPTKTEAQDGRAETAGSADEGPPLTEQPLVTEDPRTIAADAGGDLKIYGGDPVAPNTFRSTVGVFRPGSTKASCTGTLIQPNVVLTAGHCVCSGIRERIYIGDDPTKGTGVFVAVADAESGLDCTRKDMKLQLDLAVLRLARAITPSEARPAMIATPSQIDAATTWRAVGFGATDAEAKIVPGDKRTVRIVRTSNACKGFRDGQPDSRVYGCMPGEEIVAGRKGTPDTCNGDSGGPLFVSPQGTGDGPDAAFLLAGVTSRPTRGWTRPCGDGGIYERLDTRARGWIAQKTAGW